MKLALVFSSLLALASLPVCAQSDDLDKGAFTAYFENDLFAGTDRYYTSGVKLSWTSTDLAKFSDTIYASPLTPLLDRIPFINNPGMQKNLAFSVGQNIYTPDDTESFERVEDDRPYAGWLYVGLGIVWKNSAVRHGLVLNIGVVGSYAYGEEAQRLVHETRGLDVPNGWDNQLHNEVGVVLTYEATSRWPWKADRVGIDYEFLPHAGFAVGNVQTSVSVGGEFRVGVNLPDDFGTPGIDSSATTSTPVEGDQQARRPKAFDVGAYVFARGGGHAVAHNIFLDGNTFSNTQSVDKEWLVGDLSVGASLNYKNTKLTYALTYRTKEFKGQEEAQTFGSVSVTFAF